MCRLLLIQIKHVRAPARSLPHWALVGVCLLTGRQTPCQGLLTLITEEPCGPRIPTFGRVASPGERRLYSSVCRHVCAPSHVVQAGPSMTTPPCLSPSCILLRSSRTYSPNSAAQEHLTSVGSLQGSEKCLPLPGRSHPWRPSSHTKVSESQSGECGPFH